MRAHLLHRRAVKIEARRSCSEAQPVTQNRLANKPIKIHPVHPPPRSQFMDAKLNAWRVFTPPKRDHPVRSGGRVCRRHSQGFQIKGVRNRCAAIATAALVGLLAQPAQAETFSINVASGSPPVVPWVKMISEVFIPEVDKRLDGQYKINWIESYSGTAAKVGGVLEAVESGLIEMGQVYAIFEQDKLVLQNITYMTPFGSDDLELVTRMIGEMHDEHPALKQAWEAHGQVFIAPIGLDTHYLATNFPVRSIDDLKGRRIGGAGTIANWLNGVGATAVAGNFSVHYNNIQTGVYDGLLNFSSGIFPNKLHEVAPYLTRVDFGAQFVGALTVNRDTWNDFPDEVKAAFIEAGEVYRVKVSEALQSFAKVAEAKMVEQGATEFRLSTEERARWAKALPDFSTDWVKRAEGKGLPAREILDAWMRKQAENGVELAREWGQ